MKVLIVARCKNERFAPFITEQVNVLEQKGIQCQYFGIKKQGILGYISHLRSFRRIIRSFQPDIIHAHYGLCGLFANVQRQIPVVTTYHGSDINVFRVRVFSRVAVSLSALNIFVSKSILEIIRPVKHFALIPCGVTLDSFPVTDKMAARVAMDLDPNDQFILFAGAFDNRIKNAPLAKASVALLNGPQLLELNGYSRSEVAMLIQASDALLMTSYSEGSPQVIKEAMACGCPIVSVDVGDVRNLISGLDGCYVVKADKYEIARALRNSLRFSGRTGGRRRLIDMELTNDQIASLIIGEYKEVLSRTGNNGR